MNSSKIRIGIGLIVVSSGLVFISYSHTSALAQSCPTSCPDTCNAIDCGGPTDYCAYPGGGCPQGYSASGTCCCPPGSPIIVDVNGDGFSLTDAIHGVVFTIGTKGHPMVSWTSALSDDGWLVLDRNANGLIDDGTELFGNFTPQPTPGPGQARNGFLALAEYDKPQNGGNADGRIDHHDLVYENLRLWVDKNHNGISEPNELFKLDALGIGGIDLDYHESKKSDEFGNVFRYRAKTFDLTGAHVGKWAWDVYLTVVHSVQPQRQPTEGASGRN